MYVQVENGVPGIHDYKINCLQFGFIIFDDKLHGFFYIHSVYTVGNVIKQETCINDLLVDKITRDHVRNRWRNQDFPNRAGVYS